MSMEPFPDQEGSYYLERKDEIFESRGRDRERAC